MIKAIIFDLGNVIVPFDFGRAYQRMEEVSGLSREQIRTRISTAGLGPMLESGQIEPLDFIEQINRLLGTRVAYDEFRNLWVSIFERRTLIPEDLLVSLRDRYRLLLLSNTNALHFGWLDETFPHLSHFHHRVLSHEVRALKPDPRIYAEAIKHSGCHAGECFFTDDIPAYVEGACAAGLDAVQFTGLEKLLSDLRTRGIEV
jgi:putative hydrolase of the HAD superfamily